MGDLYLQRKAIDSVVAGPSIPSIPSADTLKGLRLIRQSLEIDELKIPEGAAREVAKQQKKSARYLGQAATLLNNDKELAKVFGVGYEGMTQVAGILKQIRDEDITKARLSKYALDDDEKKEFRASRGLL